MNVLSRLDTPTGKLEGLHREHICTKQVLLTDIVRPEISQYLQVAVFTALLGGPPLRFRVSYVPRQAKELEAAISSYKADMEDAATTGPAAV